MNIVCISASKVPSSTANSIEVMKVCQALVQLGHQVHLLVPGSHPVDWEVLARHYGLMDDFPVEWMPADTRLKRYDFSIKAVRRARALRADAVYVWPPQAAFLALWVGLPVLLELHDRPEGKLGPQVFGAILRHKGPKRILSITKALASYIEHTFNYWFAPGELVITPNGVDLERFENLPQPEEARRLLSLEEKPTAGYTGHLYPGRGMELLEGLALRFPQVQFLWVGGRPKDVDQWRFRLYQQEIENVRLFGFVENSRLPLYQAAADFLLMPYERTITGSSGGNSAPFCSPMKMFEYMACGRAIITSDLPVIREVLDESRALFCPPEDLDAWSAAFHRLLHDPQARLALGSSARAAAGNFTWIERARKSLEGFPAAQRKIDRFSSDRPGK
jgi:glycosyltransferase involved in cell wall biosynthesis